MTDRFYHREQQLADLDKLTSRRGATSGLMREITGRYDTRVVTFAQVAEDLAARPVRELR